MKIKSFILHEALYVQGLGNIKTNVNEAEYKTLEATLSVCETLVVCNIKGISFGIPVTNCKTIVFK